MNVRVLRSELIGQTKMKIEARQSIHSRRTSKNSPVYENHNHENNGVVDSQNHQNGSISSKKCTSTVNGVGLMNHEVTKNSGVLSSDSKMDSEITSTAVTDLKNALNKVQNNGSSLSLPGQISSDNEQEISNLKDLLILNLDLIQHQQQLLIARDRQIKTLTADKDALKGKLERMERRLSLLKQKGDIQDTHLSNLSSADSDQQRTQSVEKTHKRKSDVKLTTPRKQSRQRLQLTIQQQTQTTKPVTTTEPTTHALRSRTESNSESEIRAQHPAAPCSGVTVKPLRHCREVEDKIDLVRTDSRYFIPYTEFHDPEIVGKVINSPNRRKKIRVEVPKWRFHPVAACYQMEGTEVTEDDVYLKRHLRFENDEKRRKRWDMQRLREQTAYEKLVSGRTGSRLDTKPVEQSPVNTFMADPADVKYIEVAETIPVNIFGYPLPLLKSTDFTLKWTSRSNVDLTDSKYSSKLKRR